jgi:signal peptidase
MGVALLFAIAIAGVLAWHGGYRLYIVQTGSMTPTLLPGDVVLDGPPKGNYHPGEVITFRHSDLTTDLVTHSVIGVQAGKIRTKGDSNRTADPWEIRPDQVQGVVVRRIPRLGYLLIFFRQPAGIVSIILGGLALTMMRRLHSPTAARRAGAESMNKLTPPTSPSDAVEQHHCADKAPDPPGKSGAGTPAG